MRVVLADVKSNRGFVSKDTVVGGYGSRLDPFSRVTTIIAYLKKWYHDVPSVHMAYSAAILARAGHDGAVDARRVWWTATSRSCCRRSSITRPRPRGPTAMRARGVKVGFIGITASKMPELFADHCDFIFNGEPEAAVMRLAAGRDPVGHRRQRADRRPRLAAVPALGPGHRGAPAAAGIRFSSRPVGGGYPLLASRGCPEFCTYCPHRILAGYRVRSIGNIVDEMERLCDQVPRPYVIFRDPLFTEQRDRVVELCDAIQSRGLNLTFEAETRLDRLDVDLLDTLYAAGLPRDELRRRVARSGRRSRSRAGGRSRETHQREIIEHCREAGDRHGGVLRARLPAGRLEFDRGDDRLRHRSRARRSRSSRC